MPNVSLSLWSWLRRAVTYFYFQYASFYGFLSSLFCGARASSLDSRSPAPHPLDARQLLDVCASVNTESIGFFIFDFPVQSSESN